MFTRRLRGLSIPLTLSLLLGCGKKGFEKTAYGDLNRDGVQEEVSFKRAAVRTSIIVTYEGQEPQNVGVFPNFTLRGFESVSGVQLKDSNDDDLLDISVLRRVDGGTRTYNKKSTLYNHGDDEEGKAVFSKKKP